MCEQKDCTEYQKQSKCTGHYSAAIMYIILFYSVLLYSILLYPTLQKSVLGMVLNPQVP